MRAFYTVLDKNENRIMDNPNNEKGDVFSDFESAIEFKELLETTEPGDWTIARTKVP